jgi:hypothetical protein
MALLRRRRTSTGVRLRPGAKGWLLLLAAVFPNRAAAQQAVPLEYRVKAAYLLNFTRYIQWPPGAFAEAGAPLRVCVLGSDPFGDALERTFADRTAQGRRIVVAHVEAAAQARDCHVVFISGEEWARHPDVLAAVRSPGVLTVGEGSRFAEYGGVLSFVPVERNVRFAVNLDASDAARLRISSRMLELAVEFHGRRRGPGP